MQTDEIRSENWVRFCQEMTDLNEGALLTIESLEPSGGTKQIVKDAPLKKFILDKSGECNDILNIQTNETVGQKPDDHFIIEPIHLRIRSEANDRKILEIEAESGITRVRFKPGRFPSS
ncbi:MAG: hypothetical protein JWN25_2132 [Verrucomicrobiales bacterium]|nr:hypothetical protein [Verrucomicrobiales bacterium]MDB6129046.1 hypothetical protein [Verrucomicrobiales bacterium]